MVFFIIFITSVCGGGGSLLRIQAVLFSSVQYSFHCSSKYFLTFILQKYGLQHDK